MTLLPIIAFAVVWFGVARFYKTKGKGVVIRHLTGFAVGALALIIAAIFVAPKTESLAQSKQAESPQTLEQKTETVEPPAPEQPKEEAKTETVKADPEQLKTEDLKKEKSNDLAQTIGININRFSQRVNVALADIGSPYKMGTKLKTEKGKVDDIVSYQFSKNFGVIVSIDKKTQNVVSLLTIITPEANKADSNMIMMFSNAAVLSAFEGKNQLKTVGKQIMETTSNVMQKYSTNKKDTSDSFIFNGKKYRVSVSSYTGIMSSAGFVE